MNRLVIDGACVIVAESGVAHELSRASRSLIEKSSRNVAKSPLTHVYWNCRPAGYFAKGAGVSIEASQIFLSDDM
jgi:hypothetical protein